MIDGEFVVDVDFVDRGYHLNNNTALLTSNSQRHIPQSKGGGGVGTYWNSLRHFSECVRGFGCERLLTKNFIHGTVRGQQVHEINK